MRLIDADALKENAYLEGGAQSIAEMVVTVSDIDDAPTIQAYQTAQDVTIETPVRHGKWIFIRDEGDGNSLYSCSECGQGDIHCPEVIVPYCWHCGAKMDAEGN